MRNQVRVFFFAVSLNFFLRIVKFFNIDELVKRKVEIINTHIEMSEKLNEETIKFSLDLFYLNFVFSRLVLRSVSLAFFFFSY